MAQRTLDVIGVPSSAGAHGPGQEKAPAALRDAGLISRLVAAGVSLEDHGDLPLERFRPDPQNRHRQNLARVREVADGVANAVERSVAAGHLPLILGGDCSITLGVLTGMLRSTPDLGLLYFDGDADMTTPETTRSGIFDSMGMAHILGLQGAAPELARMGPRAPLLPPDHVVLFGFLAYEAEPEEVRLIEKTGILQFPAPKVRGLGTQPAREAIRRLEERSDAIVVHFDVDVMDSAEIPLANWPHYGALSLDEAMASLEVFVSSPKLAAVVITEINPDHDPDGSLMARLIDGLVRALRPLAAYG